MASAVAAHLLRLGHFTLFMAATAPIRSDEFLRKQRVAIQHTYPPNDTDTWVYELTWQLITHF
jgi:hypothetical protein